MESKLKGESTSKVSTAVNGETVEFTERDQIKKQIAQFNEAKYDHTEGSSQLLQRKFINSLGSFGEGPDISKVLDGTYPPPASASDDTIAFLNSCKFTAQDAEQITPKPTTDRYKDHAASQYQRKEYICTYYHHIGHYKSVFNNDNLSCFFFQRADIPEISGYSATQHKSCIDLVVMKKARCYNIKKQCTISILDTEYIQMNK